MLRGIPSELEHGDAIHDVHGGVIARLERGDWKAFLPTEKRSDPHGR